MPPPASRDCGFSGRLAALLLLLAGLPSMVRAADAPGPPDPTPDVYSWRAGEATLTLTVPADSLRLWLPNAWIQASSLRLRVGDRSLVRGVDYLLDPRRGTIRLLLPLPPGTELAAEYRYFPVPVRAEYRRRDLRTTREAEAPTTAAPSSARARPEEAMRLDLTGSKTLSLEVGSRRDAALRQSLDLALNGRVGRDLTIRAVLTDRRTPLESDGGSARLSDLDRILVEAESPNAHLTLGDIRLTAPTAEFLRYDRRLQGVQVEATPSSASAFAAAATAPGAYVTREFLGQEGKQGPYLLAEATASGAGAIVAGSERITLDGRLLTRGETEDYLLDYGAGTLTFTGRHPITAYSEISVEYQVVTDRYRRSVYGGGAGYAPRAVRAPKGGDDLVRLSFLSEGDDRARPVLPLTEAQRRALRAAGDSLTEELSSGVIYLGPGRGEYDLVRNDTLAVSFYLYKGSGGGSYQVRFDEVGAGEGDYRDTTATEGTRFYVYAGRKKGSFLPGTAVPRPERTMVGVVSLAPRFGDRLRLRAEGALSDHDPNTFSSRDDSDNVGGAFVVEPTAGPFAVGGGEVRVRGAWRSVDRRFHPLDRIRAAFDAKGWSVSAERLAEGDRRRSLGAAFTRGKAQFALTAEDLDNLRDYRGRRGTGEAQAKALGLDWKGRITRVRTFDRAGGAEIQGRRRVDQASLDWPGSWVRIGAACAQERDERGAGDGRKGSFFREASARLGTGSRLVGVGAELSWTRRVRWNLEGRRAPRLDTGDTGLLIARWNRTAGRVVEAEVSARELRPAGEGERQRSRLARLRWSERRANDAYVQEGRWELSATDRADRAKEIRYVGAGAGHYDSLGVFAGTGDYEIYYLDLGDSLRVNRLDFSLRNELDLSRLAAPRSEEAESLARDPLRRGARRLLRTLRLVWTWTAGTETSRDASWYLPRMLPVLLGNRHLPLVDASMRAEGSVLPAARWFSPRVRWERRRSERSFLANTTESSQSSLWSLRLRSRPRERWTAEFLTEWDRTEQDVLIRGRGTGGDGWRSVRAALEQRVQLHRRLAVGCDVSARTRHRLVGGESAQVYEGTPSITWSPQPHNRLEIRLTRTSVARSGGQSAAGRLLETPGGDGRVIGTMRLRQELDLSLWFRDRQPDHAPSTQEGRMELRATF